MSIMARVRLALASGYPRREFEMKLKWIPRIAAGLERIRRRL